MTNTTNRRRCNDCNVLINARNTKDHHQHDLCDRCYELAGLENEHQDGFHEDEANADCLMCDSNARGDHSRDSVSPAPHKRRSHAECYAIGAHENSRQGRALCRAKKTL